MPERSPKRLNHPFPKGLQEDLATRTVGKISSQNLSLAAKLMSLESCRLHLFQDLHMSLTRGRRYSAAPIFQCKTSRIVLTATEGSPCKNGYVESFNARFRDEMLNREIFYSLSEAQSSSKAGGGTTTQSGPTALWDTDHRHRKPSSRWTSGLSCTNYQIGPVGSGYSFQHYLFMI